MRILFAGATGVLGRATLPHLRGHDVTGLTRSPERLQLLRELGAESAVCDVYDYEALLSVARRVQPQVLVNFVTDLASGTNAANSRVRRKGGENLLNTARAAGASRLVVESVAFALEGDAARAVEQLERRATASAGPDSPAAGLAGASESRRPRVQRQLVAQRPRNGPTPR